MSTVVEVLSIAGSVSIQDHGRAGYQRYGVAEGGAMDRFALHQGATLLNNSTDAAVLEMAGAGARLEISGEKTAFACTGAPMSLQINGQTLRWNSSFVAAPGDIVEIGSASQGVYGYLHIAGGFEVPAILGSRATHSRAGFGGHEGRVLIAGDKLAAAGSGIDIQMRGLPPEDYFNSELIRIVWGAQAHLFDQNIRSRFLDTTFTMTMRRDRMGARLSADDETFLPASGLTGISDAVLAGDIQIAGDGAATVLLADRQPTGGYPRIATVISADLGAVAQMRSGRQFKFGLLGVSEAVDVLRAQDRRARQLPSLLQPLVRDPSEITDLLEYNLIDGFTTGEEPVPIQPSAKK